MAQEIATYEAIEVEQTGWERFRYRSMRRMGPWLQRPLGLMGGFIILVVVACALLAPLIAPFDPRGFVGPSLEAPNSTHLLGTNNLGQDVLSRTIYGAQVSITVGVVTAVLGVSVGTFLGIVTGYVGGWLDMTVQRVFEVTAAFPGVMLTLVIISAIGRPTEAVTGDPNLIKLAWDLRPLEVALAVALVFGSLRVVRSVVLGERGKAYIEASQVIGASRNRILFRHLLPNVVPFVIVQGTSIVSIVILIEASLSFIGYGVAPGTPSWGIDLTSRNRQFFVEAPWLLAGPGIALTLTVLGFNFLGDAIRDIIDPRLRGSR